MFSYIIFTSMETPDGEMGAGELGEGPKRKTGARRREVWPGTLSAESDAWPHRKAGDA